MEAMTIGCWLLIVLFVAGWQVQSASVVRFKHNPKPCLYKSKAIRGVLKTPNFPGKFATPIDCLWIIENTDFENRLIVVYLTQLFLFEGLMFKCDYDYYPKYNTGEVLFNVSHEHHWFNAKIVKCDKQYLIMTLKLQHIEGTHIRVLDGLLDVFGFNITYEITKKPRARTCSMSKCGFTGHCYDHYTHFKCDCFPGYAGPKCSEGKKSQCYINKQPICKNGGECIHLGEAAVKCSCASGFYGARCGDIITQQHSTNDSANCTDCLISCRFDETLKNVCKCPKKQTTRNLNDLIGFSSTALISNISTPNEVALKIYLAEHISQLIKFEVPSMEDVQILYLNYQWSGIEMTFRFYADKRDETRIMDIIGRWSEIGSIGNITLLEKYEISVSIDSSLALKSVNTNKLNDVIRENEEIVLSCVARGSKNMIFRWFKNDIQINITPGVRHKWTRLIEDDDKDQYTCLLGIGKATQYDEGIFTCQVEDYGYQQCLSKQIRLKERVPTVWLSPTAMIVHKGDPFTIICSAKASYDDGFVYTWTKNGQLLKVKTEVEHYEMLFPTGSILRVLGIHKSTTYSCLVQNDKLSSEISITVDVMQSNSSTASVTSPDCAAGYADGYFWNETAAGFRHMQMCPKNYSAGKVWRLCTIGSQDGAVVLTSASSSNTSPASSWLPPDYSNCKSTALESPIHNFWMLMHGYETTTILRTLQQYLQYVMGNVLLRGEAQVILNVVNQALEFNNLDTSHYEDFDEITTTALNITDHLMQQKQSINKEKQVVFLQNIIKSQTILLGEKVQVHYYKQFETIQVVIKRVTEQILANIQYPANVDREGTLSKSINLIRVIYYNLSEFLTETSRVRLKREDTNIDYKICSVLAGIWLSEDLSSVSVFNYNYKYNFSLRLPGEEEAGSRCAGLGEDWQMKCAVAGVASSTNVWDTNSCLTHIINKTLTECVCSTPGTMTLLLVKQSKLASADVLPNPHKLLTIVIGCSICLLLIAVSGLVLVSRWLCERSCFTFLKLQCCVAVCGIMTVVLFASTRHVPQDHFLYIVSCLEVFFFVGFSSQLSIMLIIYSELVRIDRKDNIKETIVGIVTGGPLVVVFGNHLAHRTLDIQLRNWWLESGSLSFNVFASCISIMFILFILLLCMVLKMLKTDSTFDSKFLSNRTKLAIKCSLTFHCLLLEAATSVFGINKLQDVIWHCVFSALSVILAILIAVCFVVNKQIFETAHVKNTETNSNIDSSKSGGQLNLQLLSNSPKNGTNQATPTTHSQRIEQYNSSPTMSFRRAAVLNKSGSLNSPDILAVNDVFANLDLVASSLQIDGGGGGLPAPDDTQQEETKYPVPSQLTCTKLTKLFDDIIDGNKYIAGELTTTTTLHCDNDKYIVKVLTNDHDAVMNSISNDLNYLLNGD